MGLEEEWGKSSQDMQCARTGFSSHSGNKGPLGRRGYWVFRRFFEVSRMSGQHQVDGTRLKEATEPDYGWDMKQAKGAPRS